LAYLDLAYEEAQTYLLANVIGSVFVAEVLQQPTEEKLTSVVLHNTAVEEPVNINHCILNEIVSKMQPPQLPQVYYMLLTIVFKCFCFMFIDPTLFSSREVGE
jgi:hypothetical protein